ncbi:cytochrome c [Paucibacter soli]|uniref:cytochrome c n=1 Tax=Paucibacter soli TaxID=3133433 RepID=UPI0030A02B6A
MKTATFLLVAALALLSAGHCHAAEAAGSATPGLRLIMQELGRQMQLGADAIAREDWAAIAALAPKLAEHAAPPVTEKLRILGALGGQAGQFRELDQQVHHAAQAMGAAAQSKDGQAVIAAYARVQTACLACHQGFRQPLKDALESKR